MSERHRICAHIAGTIGKFALDAAFEAPRQGVTALFGPSGCGKTSVLRAVAGLMRFPKGYFRFGPSLWQDEQYFMPPHKRPIGYVFQEPSLFTHLNVRRNLLFAYPQKATQPSVGYEEVVEFLRLRSLLERSVETLSGGERQRVAIGRALLSQPELLLMDEPLSALDAFSREEIIPFLDGLSGRFALPIFYVSHDFNEIERLADWLALMENGKIIRTGAFQELQNDINLPLAKARDAVSTIVARATELERGLCAFEAGGQKIFAPASNVEKGGLYRLSIKTSEVSLCLKPQTDTSILNTLSVKLLGMTPLSEAEVIVSLRLEGADNEGSASRDDSRKLDIPGIAESYEKEGQQILARITQRSIAQLALVPGQRLYAQVKSVNIRPWAHHMRSS